ncbi:hypothetical protein B0H10DRAFT_1268601 [Mycena sp. CBHHK59/15]|nr:hypothetical protein B0H10DRAFT_1268601 [Mycena sp. CBHHK59/15]
MSNTKFCENFTSLATMAIPDGTARNATLGILLLGTISLVLLSVLPTRLTASLDKSLCESEKLYHDIFDAFRANLSSSSKVDAELAARLIVLQDKTIELRMKTLRHGTSLAIVWWLREFWALLNGHSFAILRCIWNVKALRNEFQLRKHEKLCELNSELAVGNSPACQLMMRHRHSSGSGNYTPVPAAGHFVC